MKKLKIIIPLLTIIILIVSYSVFICINKEPIKKDIISIEFVISGDTKGSYYSYRYLTEDENAYVVIKSRPKKDDNLLEIKQILSKEDNDKIIKLYNKLRPKEWQNYSKESKSDDNVVGTFITYKKGTIYYKDDNYTIPKKEKKAEKDILEILKSYEEK